MQVTDLDAAVYISVKSILLSKTVTASTLLVLKSWMLGGLRQFECLHGHVNNISQVVLREAFKKKNKKCGFFPHLLCGNTFWGEKIFL